jgi:uncharacterized protein (UPF0335 family)
MYKDPIVDEVRRIRHDYARRFGFDLRAMAEDLRLKELDHADRLVSFQPKPARCQHTA